MIGTSTPDAPSGEGTLLIGELNVKCQYSFIEKLESAAGLSIECLVEADLSTAFKIHFSISSNSRVELSTQWLTQPVRCVVETYAHKSEESSILLALCPTLSPITYKASGKLMEITALLVNFCGYHHEYPLFLRSKDWIIILNKAEKAHRPTERYFDTHVISISRRDSEGFLADDDAIEIIERVRLFLSFCHESWIALRITTGLDQNGAIIFRQYGTHKIAPAKQASGWVDRHHPDAMAAAFDGFVKAFETVELEETVRKAIYWYIRANTNDTGPDGGIILSQAALERLSWHIVKFHFVGRSLRKEAAKNGAAGKIRTLLNALDIPTAIPSELDDLCSCAKRFGWEDAPHAFTEARNNLTHPKNEYGDDRLPYYQIYLLGKWWIELALLRLFGFNGKYSNRTRKHRRVGMDEKVPWA